MGAADALHAAVRGTLSERLKRTLQIHGRGRFPAPAGWTITITPEHPLLLPDQEIDVAVRIETPQGFAGRQAFTVNARTTEHHTDREATAVA